MSLARLTGVDNDNNNKLTARKTTTTTTTIRNCKASGRLL
jgi:hypothetical protein